MSHFVDKLPWSAAAVVSSSRSDGNTESTRKGGTGATRGRGCSVRVTRSVRTSQSRREDIDDTGRYSVALVRLSLSVLLHLSSSEDPLPQSASTTLSLSGKSDTRRGETGATRGHGRSAMLPGVQEPHRLGERILMTLVYIL